MDLPYDAVEIIQTNGIAFIDLVSSADPETNVRSCPDWNITDLARHQAGVWNFWSRIVADPIIERSDLQAIESPADLEGPMLFDWLATAHNALYSALVRAAPDQEVWTWTGRNRDAQWVRRRMAQESAVHRWDAADVCGDPYEVPTSIAADGIDEFLEFFAARERREGEMKVGGTVHLHCTDTTEADTAGGEWYISAMKEPSATFTREHRKGDAAIKGRAHDLLMWLWRRNRDDSAVEIIGKDVVARRFRAYTDLD